MKGSIAKKIVTLFLFTVLFAGLMATGFVACKYMDNKAEPVQTHIVSTEPDPIFEFRKEREQLRMLQKSQLNDIIHDPETDQEIIDLAQRRLLGMMEAEKQETILEGILQMRGFEEAVAIMNGESANILLKKEVLTPQETAVILDLVLRETGIKSGNVKIIPIN